MDIPIITGAILLFAVVIVFLLFRNRNASHGPTNLPKSKKNAVELVRKAKLASVYDLPPNSEILPLVSGGDSEDVSDIEKRLSQISQKLAVNKQALRTFFRAAQSRQVPEEALSETLIETSQRYHELQQELISDPATNSENIEVSNASKAALRAINEGNTRLADEKLSSIERAFIDESKKNNNPELMFNAARKRAQRAEVSTLDLNFNTAGRHYRNAHMMTPQDYKEHKVGFLLRSSRYYAEAKMYDDALNTAESAIQLAEQSFGKNHPFTAESLNALGTIYSLTGRYDEAISAFQRSLAILESEYGEDALSVGKTLNHLAETYVNLKTVEKAIEPYERSMVIHEKNYGSLHDKVIKILSSLVNVYRVTGRFDDAEKLLIGYIRRLESQPRSLQGAKLAMVKNSLGLLYMHSSRLEEAKPQFAQALALTEKIFGVDHPEVARTLNNLANLEDRIGNHHAATALLRRSLRIVKQRYPENHPNVLLVSKNFNAVASRNRSGKKAVDERSSALN